MVQLFLGRYLADDALERIRCTEPGRQHCQHPVLNSQTPAGVWKLLPLGHEHDAAPTASRLLAVYDLTRGPQPTNSNAGAPNSAPATPPPTPT
ncbi:MAG: hypothetical protein LBV78_18435 [Kitasatospora sp.]|nr:hypothetical protein [Kitasatospora sp.]